jgi:uncharacterized protein YkwD
MPLPSWIQWIVDKFKGTTTEEQGPFFHRPPSTWVPPTETTPSPWNPPPLPAPTWITTPPPSTQQTTEPPWTLTTRMVNVLLHNLLDACNRSRQQRSQQDGIQRPPLTLNQKLVNAAQEHNNWMAQNNTLSHKEGSVVVAQRVTAEGYAWAWVGENIAEGYSSVEALMQGWMNSSGHRTNILRPQFTEVGFGYGSAGSGPQFWTADFAAPGMRGFGLREEECVFLSGVLREEKSGETYLPGESF